MPPQICELSQELKDDYPSLGNLFEIDEMVQAIETLAHAKSGEAE